MFSYNGSFIFYKYPPEDYDFVVYSMWDLVFGLTILSSSSVFATFAVVEIGISPASDWSQARDVGDRVEHIWKLHGSVNFELGFSGHWCVLLRLWRVLLS